MNVLINRGIVAAIQQEIVAKQHHFAVFVLRTTVRPRIIPMTTDNNQHFATHSHTIDSRSSARRQAVAVVAVVRWQIVGAGGDRHVKRRACGCPLERCLRARFSEDLQFVRAWQQHLHTTNETNHQMNNTFD